MNNKIHFLSLILPTGLLAQLPLAQLPLGQDALLLCLKEVILEY